MIHILFSPLFSFFLHYTFIRGETWREKMGLRKDVETNPLYSDLNYEETKEDLKHKKHVRKMLEERLEHKRLKQELEEEWDSEFDWD